MVQHEGSVEYATLDVYNPFDTLGVRSLGAVQGPCGPSAGPPPPALSQAVLCRVCAAPEGAAR